MLVPGLVATKSAQAQDAEQPWGGVARDAAGNLYGTATAGGKYGAGAVYELDKSGTETVLYSFKGTGGDGAVPSAGVVLDGAGNLYGTTNVGGNNGCNAGNGCGTVFKLAPTKTGWKETVLYRFKGTGGDGGDPNDAGVVLDAAGNLYGATNGGGRGGCAQNDGCGTVYKVALTKTGWKETVLHRFKGTGGDGFEPNSGVVLDGEGNLYGTTVYGGGSNYGTVYELDKSGTETVLYSFKGTGGDGAYPNGSVIRDAAGNLYGTTIEGGGYGNGTVFKLGKSGNETVLYRFTGGADGAQPVNSLVRDVKGNLYGSTFYGGDFACNDLGCGVVFKVSTKGTETVLHTFTGKAGDDGAIPVCLPALILDAAGNLYGTTYLGSANGEGTVFKLDDKSGNETILYAFQ